MKENPDAAALQAALRENAVSQDPYLEGNEQIEEAIDRYRADSSDDNLIGVLEAIRQRMHVDGHFIFPVLTDEEDACDFAIRSVRTKDGKDWFAAFTSPQEYRQGERSRVLSYSIGSAMKNALQFNGEGYVINPWGRPFFLTKRMMESIFEADGEDTPEQ